MKNKERIIYYTDELNDDFMDNKMEHNVSIPESYKYKRENKFYNFFAALFYYGFVKPVLRTYNYFAGVRYKNLKSLKKFKKTGCFIYANHTSVYDMFTIQSSVIRGKRCNIIGLADTYSNKFLRHLVRPLGYIPIPTDIKVMRNFLDSLDFYINKEHQDILIFPEAHVWPNYTKIRPFSSVSFRYPAKLNAPVIPIVTTYRKSKFSNKPKLTLVVGEAIYPKEELDLRENKEYLRDECYKSMVEISEKYPQYEYIKYIKKEQKEL